MKLSGILVLSKMVQIVGKFGLRESGERLKDFHSQSAGSHTPMNCFPKFWTPEHYRRQQKKGKSSFYKKGRGR